MSIALTVFVVAETVEYFRRKPAPPTPPITPPASPTRSAPLPPPLMTPPPQVVEPLEQKAAAKAEPASPPDSPTADPSNPPKEALPIPTLWAPPLPPATLVEVMVNDPFDPLAGVKLINDAAAEAYPGVTNAPRLGLIRTPDVNFTYLYFMSATPPVAGGVPVIHLCPVIEAEDKGECFDY